MTRPVVTNNQGPPAHFDEAPLNTGTALPNGHDLSALDNEYNADAEPKALEPIDIIGAPDLVGWPEITTECLPAPLYDYVMAEAERLNADPCPLAAHVIAACSASISDAWSIRPKLHDHWTQQPRVWSCVVKEVGGRGTDMIRAAFWPINERSKEMLKAHRSAHAAWKTRQAARKKSEKDETDEEPRYKRLTTQDATIEAVSDILSAGEDDGKLGVICDELVAFIGGFGRYTQSGGTARAMWLEAYDGGPQHIDRVRRGHVYVPNWSVVVAGNIQPRRLAGMAKDLIDDGLFQRFMTVHAKPAEIGVSDDVPLAHGVGGQYRDLHQAMADLRPPIGAENKAKPAWSDDEGRAERQRFMRLIERLKVDPTLPTIIRETAPKWSGLLARLALVFHVAGLGARVCARSQPTEGERAQVLPGTVAMAASFLRRIALPNLFRLGFETMPEEGAPAAHARWIAGHILAHRTEVIMARDIGRVYGPLRGKPMEIAVAMESLVDAAWALPIEGRSNSQRWAVNPAVHGMFAKAAQFERDRRARLRDVLGQRIADL